MTVSLGTYSTLLHTIKTAKGKNQVYSTNLVLHLQAERKICLDIVGKFGQSLIETASNGELLLPA